MRALASRSVLSPRAKRAFDSLVPCYAAHPDPDKTPRVASNTG